MSQWEHEGGGCSMYDGVGTLARSSIKELVSEEDPFSFSINTPHLSVYQSSHDGSRNTFPECIFMIDPQN